MIRLCLRLSRTSWLSRESRRCVPLKCQENKVCPQKVAELIIDPACPMHEELGTKKKRTSCMCTFQLISTVIWLYFIFWAPKNMGDLDILDMAVPPQRTVDNAPQGRMKSSNNLGTWRNLRNWNYFTIFHFAKLTTAKTIDRRGQGSGNSQSFFSWGDRWNAAIKVTAEKKIVQNINVPRDTYILTVL